MAVILMDAVSVGQVQPIDKKWFRSTREHSGYLAHAAELRYKLLASQPQLVGGCVNPRVLTSLWLAPAPLNLGTFPCSNHVRHSRFNVGATMWVLASIWRKDHSASYFPCILLHVHRRDVHSHHSHTSVTWVCFKICIIFWPLFLGVAFSMSSHVSITIWNFPFSEFDF